MLYTYITLLLLGNAFTDSFNYNEDLSGTELLFTFLIFRHGDRTPISNDLSFSNQRAALAKIIETYGYGQLTPRGQYRGYQIGQFIRSRYSSLLSAKYNMSEIYIRSTDVTRTKMTVLTAMAAVYPPTEVNWNNHINWTPVPYSTVDIDSDYIFPQYEEVFKKISDVTGSNVTGNPFMVYFLYENYACQKSLGLPLEDAIEEILPVIKKVASVIMQSVVENEDHLNLLAGVILNEFFTATNKIIKGDATPKVRVYSAHDINIIIMIAASRIKEAFRPGIPKYGAIFALELRRDVKTGQYFVLAVFVPDTDTNEVQYLPIEGCNGILCNLDTFRDITSKLLLNEKEWKRHCKIDFEIFNIIFSLIG